LPNEFGRAEIFLTLNEVLYLRSNGRAFPKDDGSVYQAMIAIAEKRLEKKGLAVVLQQLSEKQI